MRQIDSIVQMIRAVLKAFVIVPMLLAAVADGQVRKWLGVMRPGPEGAVWVHRWCRRLVWALVIECEVSGPIPDADDGMLAVVSNHLSYLDVLLYSATRPLVMVSKTEVRRWPLIGWITAQAGTIYVQRADVTGGQTQTHAEVNAMMAAAYRSGLPVMFFPEGTTTDGSEIMPLRRGLYNSVVYDEVPVKVAAIGYEFTQRNRSATIGEDVCFVGDAEFGPHLLGFLGLRGVKARMRFCDEAVAGKDRFALARNSRAMMVELCNGLGLASATADSSAAPRNDKQSLRLWEQAAAVEGAEDLFDRPVDGLGAAYGEGGAGG
jgi:1-acyl-sn-glycerol-3-phosphate acyltransferase